VPRNEFLFVADIFGLFTLALAHPLSVAFWLCFLMEVLMRSAGMRRMCGWGLPVFSFLLFAPSLTAQAIRLHVDLTDAPRNIYHAHLQIPAHAGEMSLVFPKFIPGNHRPSGPIGALTGIRMEAAGHALSTRRRH